MMQMNQQTRPAQAKEMYSEIKPSVDSRGVVGGASGGGGGAISAEDMRRQRLARLGGGGR